jgi:uncharacterized protein (TIGR02284 family)
MIVEKSIQLLNTLIEVNNDIIEGYETASLESVEPEIKNLFYNFIQTSQKCNYELTAEVKKLGGQPIIGTESTGKFLSVWIDIKYAINKKNSKAILNLCEHGEEVASDIYMTTLRNNLAVISVDQQSMLITQHILIKADHDKVKTLREAY